MSESRIRELVAETMDKIPEIEGIVVSNLQGKVLFGHTLDAAIDQNEIARLSLRMAQDAASLSRTTDKGGLKEINISSEQGFLLILGDPKFVLTAITGSDSREQLGLIKMTLKKLLVKLK